jgi:hypothetical protein
MGWESTYPGGVPGEDEQGGGPLISDEERKRREGKVGSAWGDLQSYYNQKRGEYGFDFDISSYQDDLTRHAQYDREDIDSVLAGRKQDIDRRFADGDGGGGNGGGSGSSPAQAWNNFQPPQDDRANAFYDQLRQRSQQSLNIDRNDPIIRSQADAYSANQERAKRNYLSDIAEQRGPIANIQGERRMASERVGQATGAFEAELMGRELSARRDEIAQALSLMAGRLTSEQALALQRELGLIDAELKRMSIQQTGQLGNRSLDISSDQFLRELALREWQAGDASDRAWLGF